MINPAWEQMVNPYQQPYQPQYELDQNMINQMCQSIVRSVSIKPLCALKYETIVYS